MRRARGRSESHANRRPRLIPVITRNNGTVYADPAKARRPDKDRPETWRFPCYPERVSGKKKPAYWARADELPADVMMMIDSL